MSEAAKPAEGTPETPIVPPVVPADTPAPGTAEPSKDGAPGEPDISPAKEEDTPPPAAAEKQDDAPAKPADVVYDLTLPEDTVLDPAVVERTVAYAKAQGLSNDAAKAALDLVQQEATAAAKAAVDAWAPGGARHAELVTKWEQDTLADAALGATEADRRAALTAGKQVLAKYREANPDQAEGLVAFLETSGYGNQRDVARFLGWLGKAMGEQPLAAGRPVSTGDARSWFDKSDMNP